MPAWPTILVGDDPASAVYVGNKKKACGEVGIASFGHELAADASEDEVAASSTASTPTPTSAASSSSFRCPRTWTGCA